MFKIILGLVVVFQTTKFSKAQKVLDTISRSMHQQDFVRFNVWEMFPNILKDPMIDFTETDIPGFFDKELTESTSPLWITQPLTTVSPLALTDPELLHPEFACSKFKRIPKSDSMFTVTCNHSINQDGSEKPQQKIKLMRVHLDKMEIGNVDSFTVDQNEEIVYFFVDPERAYLLTKSRSNKEPNCKFQVIQIEKQGFRPSPQEETVNFNASFSKTGHIQHVVSRNEFGKIERILFYSKEIVGSPKQHLQFYSLSSKAKDKFIFEGFFDSRIQAEIIPTILGFDQEENHLEIIPILNYFVVLYFRPHLGSSNDGAYNGRICFMREFGEAKLFDCESLRLSTLNFVANGCSFSDSGNIQFNQSYAIYYEKSREIMINNTKYFAVPLFLVTNCRAYAMNFTINAQSGELLFTSTSKYLTTFLSSIQPLGRKNSVLFWLIKYNENMDRHYLMSLSIVTLHSRLFTRLQLNSTKLLVYLSSQRDIAIAITSPQKLASQSMSGVENSTSSNETKKLKFDLMVFRDQGLEIRPRVLNMTSSTVYFISKITGDIVGSDGEIFQGSYQLQITIFKQMSNLLVSGNLGEIWVYRNPLFGTYVTGFPYDKLSILANDPGFEMVDESGKCEYKVKSSGYFEVDNKIFVRKLKKKTVLMDHFEEQSRVKFTFTRMEFVMYYLNDGTVLIDQCTTGFDTPPKFKCIRIINSSPGALANLEVLGFYASNPHNLNEGVAVVACKSKNSFLIVQLFQANVFKSEYPEFKMNKCQSLYRFKSAVFVCSGLLTVGDSFNATVLIGFEATLYNGEIKRPEVRTISTDETIDQDAVKDIELLDLTNDREVVFSQVLKDSNYIVTYINITDLGNPIPLIQFFIDSSTYKLMAVIGKRLILYHQDFKTLLYYGQEDPYEELFYGKLPFMIPLGTNSSDEIDPSLFINETSISNMMGIVVTRVDWRVEKTWLTNITFLVYDMRFKSLHPLDRLMTSLTFANICLEDDLINVVNDIPSFSIYFKIYRKSLNVTQVIKVPLEGPRIEIELQNNLLERWHNNASISLRSFTYPASQQSIGLNMPVIVAEFDSSLVVKKKAKIKDLLSLIEETPKEAAYLSDLVSVGSHIANFSIETIFPDKPLPVKIEQAITKSLIPGFSTNLTLAKDTTIRLLFNKYVWAYDKYHFEIGLIENNTLNKIMERYSTDDKILYVYLIANISSMNRHEANYRTLVVAVLVEGEVQKSDLHLYAVNLDKPKSYSMSKVEDICRCTEARFAVIRKGPSAFKLVYQYVRESLNGTTIVSKNLLLTPINAEKTSALFKGFTLRKSNEDELNIPIDQKVANLKNYLIIKPGETSTLTYFMFYQTSSIGILYLNDAGGMLFKYFKYSDTCILRKDTQVGCKIFEQDMEIGCVVQCDQARLEVFKVRVKVDEIEGDNDKAAGVEVLRQEGYRIPVNYTVLSIFKGENLDFVVASKLGVTESDGIEKRYILMYDSSTGLIVYRMTEEEACHQKIDERCALLDVYIYQLNTGKIAIVPKYTPLGQTLYSRKMKPLIEFNVEQLKNLNKLEGYWLKIQGLTESVEIPLEELFKFKEDSLIWLYYLVGATVFLSLIGMFVLVLYQNWGIDEETRPASPQASDGTSKRKQRIKISRSMLESPSEENKSAESSV